MRGVVLAIVLTLALVASAAKLVEVNPKTKIDGQYIVVFHPNSTAEIRDLHIAELVAKRFSAGEKILHSYGIGTFFGYAGVLAEETLIEELKHPNVAYVEQDQIMTINEGYTTQSAVPSWGLARISQRNLPLGTTYSYFNSAGNGVTAYVVDTGILTTHTQFGGRATVAYNAITGEAATDLNGHGTHVSGTIGGSTVGIAKRVTLVGVKVLGANGSGSNAGVIAGVNFVGTNHQQRGTGARSVANMSLGGSASTALDQAVTAVINAGVSFALAAGNDGANACNTSPARVATAITTGATTNTDARASFSNIGTCVSVFAPGQNIVSSYIGTGNSATATLSGTSMASPHVAGVVAVRLGNLAADGNNVVPTPATIKAWVLSTATPAKVTNPGTGSPTGLLYSPFQ